MSNGPEWFAPKRYGIGAGLPVSWQGWLVLGLYLAAVIFAGLFLDGKPLAQGAILVSATAAFLLVVARTTRGGWRWRWGDKK